MYIPASLMLFGHPRIPVGLQGVVFGHFIGPGSWARATSTPSQTKSLAAHDQKIFWDMST